MRKEHYENGVLVSVTDTRTVSETEARRIAEINFWMAERLTPTDYVIIKAADPTFTGDIPEEVLEHRAAVRTAGAEAKAAVAALVAAAEDNEDKAACDAIEAVTLQAVCCHAGADTYYQHP